MFAGFSPPVNGFGTAFPLSIQCPRVGLTNFLHSFWYNKWGQVKAAHSVEELVDAPRKPTKGVLATTIGLAALLIGALGVFGKLSEYS